MSAVSAIRTTILPRMVVCLDGMYEAAKAISSHVSYVLEEGQAGQAPRLTRGHLIRLNVLAERFAEDLRRIEILCEADYTMSVLVHQSGLAWHKPERVERRFWHDLLGVINSELAQKGHISGVFLTAFWLANSIKQRVDELFQRGPQDLSTDSAGEIERDIESLTFQLSLILELFDALQDRVTIH